MFQAIFAGYALGVKREKNQLHEWIFTHLKRIRALFFVYGFVNLFSVVCEYFCYKLFVYEVFKGISSVRFSGLLNVYI